MNNIRLFRAQQGGKFSPRIGRPDRLLHQHQAFHAIIGIRLPVAPPVHDDFVPLALEKFALLVEDHIFAALSLVLIVNNKYLHTLHAFWSLRFAAVPGTSLPFGTYVTSLRLPT